MMFRLTWSNELFWATTRCGLLGLVLYLIYGLVYVSAVGQVFRRRPESVFQHAVIGIYIVAVSNLYALFHVLLPSSLPVSEAGWFQSVMLWWNVYLQWKLSFVLLFLWFPVILLALFVRPRGGRIGNPGCIPGAIIALLGTMFLQICFIAVFLGSSYLVVYEQHIKNEMIHQRQIRDLQEKIEVQHGTSQVVDTTVVPQN